MPGHPSRDLVKTLAARVTLSASGHSSPITAANCTYDARRLNYICYLKQPRQAVRAGRHRYYITAYVRIGGVRSRIPLSAKSSTGNTEVIYIE
jgi:hypothetical protein